MSISVIIPAYNEEKYLGACLEAIKKQTLKPLEIIVVDNNCTDKTVHIAHSYGVKIVKQPIQGMIPAREKGYEAAKGEIMARTDADTIVPEDWLEQIYQAFTAHPDAVAVTGFYHFPEIPKTLNLPFQLFGHFVNIQLVRILSGHNPLVGPNNAIKKSAWLKIKDEIHTDDKLVHEDIDLSCHIATVGKIVFLRNLQIPYSLRRWKKNFSYTLVEYTIRHFRSIFIHYPIFQQKQHY